MTKKLIYFLLLSVFCLSCSSNDSNTKAKKSENIKTPEEMYITAKNFFDTKNYELSYQEFTELKKLYPLSNEAIQAEIMIGFINYLKMDYDTALIEFEKIINKYPSHKNLDYVYYMIAMCNYEQINHHSLDGVYNELALENFQQVVKRFPNSEYAKDSNQKIILVKSNKAAKHMDIGRFYLKQSKYTAALNRFKIVVEDYSVTKFTPEALHRMVEAYFEMGMVEESIKTASTLGYNYPNSVWYKYSYELINKTNKNDTFIKKITNLF